MNFDIDYSHVHVVRSPQAVPLLVLVREWGRYKEAAFQLTDVILLILKGIKHMASMEHGLEVQEILDGLEDAELREKFMKSFSDVLEDLLHFMTFLDDLNTLLNPPDKSCRAMLDTDSSNSIIGVYVRLCVLEFKKMTFTQLTRIHLSLQDYFKDEDGKILMFIQQQQQQQAPLDEKAVLLRRLNFTHRLRELVLWGGSGKVKDRSATSAKVRPKRVELGNEALQLAELHGAFEHNKEGLRVLEEAIALAQRNDSALILEHTLAWLLKMESFEPNDSLSMLKKFVKVAETLNLPSLGLWGQLHQVKTQLSMSEPPKTVLSNLLLSEADYLSSHDEKEGWKSSLHLCTLTLLATTWEHYGHRLQALHYAQQVCHMMSCDELPVSTEDRESLALALTIIARHLHETGNAEKSLLLLKNSMTKFRNTGIPFKTLCKCNALLKFGEALDKQDYASARRHLMVVRKFDLSEGVLLSAVLARHEGQLGKAVEVIRSILEPVKKEDSEEFLPSQTIRAWQLLAEVNLDRCAPSKSLTNVMEALSICNKHHLPQHSSSLLLGRVMLHLNCPVECTDMLRKSSLQILSNGSLEDKGLMQLLNAQALVIQDEDISQDSECLKPMLSLLAEATSNFQESSSSSLLKSTLTLQEYLHDHVEKKETPTTSSLTKSS